MPKSTRLALKTLACTAPLILAGCASFKTGEAEVVPECQTPPKTASKFDNLLIFAHDLSKMPSAARTVQCHNLVKQQKEAPNTDTLLQLMVGRTLSDACGDTGKLLDQLAALPATSLEDETLRQFVAVEQEALKNILSATKKLNSQDKKKKKAQVGSENKESTDSVSNETRLLREKLDAIRSMEKQLDGSIDAK